MVTGKHTVVCAFTLLLLTITSYAGADKGRAEGKGRMWRLGPDIYRIGDITLDAKKRVLTCRGEVNMAEGGPIELLACLESGKVHESILIVDIEPKDLQVALLLLGLRPGRNPAHEIPEDSPEARRKPGSKVLLFVEWDMPEGPESAEPVRRRVRAEKLLWNVQTDRPAVDAEWVFLGSRVWQGQFGAELDGSIITTYHDSLAILELALPTVNDDVYYVANKELVPPAGTPVTVAVEVVHRKKATPEGEGHPDGARAAVDEED